MLKRLGAAFAALSLILPIIFLGGQLGVELLVGIVLLIVMHEFAAVASPKQTARARRVLWLVGGTVYSVLTWSPAIWAGPVVVLAVAILLTWSMFDHEDPVDGALSGAVAGVAVPYIAMAMAFIGKVRALEDGLSWLMLVLICTWAADTGAYFAGRAFGNKKLLERISPKKTWAGVYGGIGLTAVVAVALGLAGYPTISIPHAVGLGVLLAIAGVVGDLVQSMFKRARGIKDSGGIMPGHGGLYDRIDSLLFTMPIAWAYAMFFSL